MRLKLFFKFLLALGLIFWLVKSGAFDLTELAGILTPGRVLLLLSLTFALISVNCYRWKRLLAGRGRWIPYRELLPLSLIAVFFNLVTPGGVGGDVIKGIYFQKRFPGPRVDAIGSIFIDRFIGLYVLIIMAAGALLLRPGPLQEAATVRSLIFSTGGAFLLFTVIFALTTAPRARALPGARRLFARFPELSQLRNFDGRSLVEAFLLSFISQTFQVLFIVCIGFWLGEDLALADYFFIVPLGILAASLPVAPAGLGVGQAAFFFLVTIATGSESTLGPLSFSAFQVSQVVWAIPGALFYLFRKTLQAPDRSDSVGGRPK